MLSVAIAIGCSNGESARSPDSAASPQAADTRPARRDLPTDFFVKWFEAHGHKDVVVDAAGVGVGGNATRLKASLYGSKQHKDGGFVVETEFSIRLPAKDEITEFVAGMGRTEDEAITDTMRNFTLTTFHVVYKGFINDLDPHMTSKKVEMSGGERELILGDIVGRGLAADAPIDLNPMRAAIEEAVKKLPLSAKPHWIKIVYSQNENKPLTVAATLDNTDHARLTDAITKLPWPRSDRFYMAKQFIVIK